ncbi:MAG: SGNH/GDSL hydrolase family protein [Clostridia bacterium]|nr:SGNH/GDSL hydrolase family protein [Clostridia bacterium]
MKIAFLGDSITYGYALPDVTERYTTVLCRRLGLEEENHGITGTLVAKAGLNRADGKDFVSRLHLIDGADIAVIFGGTNDYFWSDAPIHGGESDVYFAHAVRTLCEYVRRKRAGKITLVVTPYPHNGVGNFLGGETWRTSSRHDTDVPNFCGHTLSEYAAVQEETCLKYGIPCLNLHKNFAFDHRRHTLDGCHPNGEGHRLLAEAIENKLKTWMDPKF